MDERLVFLVLGTRGLGACLDIRHITALAVTSSLREFEVFDASVTTKKAAEVAENFGRFLKRYATVDLHCRNGRFRPVEAIGNEH